MEAVVAEVVRVFIKQTVGAYWRAPLRPGAGMGTRLKALRSLMNWSGPQRQEPFRGAEEDKVSKQARPLAAHRGLNAAF